MSRCRSFAIVLRLHHVQKGSKWFCGLRAVIASLLWRSIITRVEWSFIGIKWYPLLKGIFILGKMFKVHQLYSKKLREGGTVICLAFTIAAAQLLWRTKPFLFHSGGGKGKKIFAWLGWGEKIRGKKLVLLYRLVKYDNICAHIWVILYIICIFIFILRIYVLLGTNYWIRKTKGGFIWNQQKLKTKKIYILSERNVLWCWVKIVWDFCCCDDVIWSLFVFYLVSAKYICCFDYEW